MRKWIKRSKIEIPSYPTEEIYAFRKIKEILTKENWRPEEEFDIDWGHILLADKYDKDIGIVLRRIKPFLITSAKDMLKAKQLQQALKSKLIEVWPYKSHWDKHRHHKIIILEQLLII